MKKFWENFWDILCWLTFVVAILALIGIIVLACLNYNIESPIMKYFVFVCIISALLFIVIFISIAISALRTPPERRIISALEEIDKQLAEEENSEDPFYEFSDTISMKLITPGHGFTKDDYKKVDNLYLNLTAVPSNELAEVLNCEPEVIEEQIDALNHILHCIDGTWDKPNEITPAEGEE